MIRASLSNIFCSCLSLFCCYEAVLTFVVYIFSCFWILCPFLFKLLFLLKYLSWRLTHAINRESVNLAEIRHLKIKVTKPLPSFKRVLSCLFKTITICSELNTSNSRWVLKTSRLTCSSATWMQRQDHTLNTWNFLHKKTLIFLESHQGLKVSHIKLCLATIIKVATISYHCISF